MSTNVGSIHYDLDLDTKKFNAEADKLKGRVSDFGKKIAAGALVAGTAITAFGVSAVKSFQDSQNASAQLEAVLKSTGGAAGVTAKQANELASSLQKTTKYSDEAVLGAQNMLLTFTNIKKDVFPDATKAVLDMSTAMGTDLQSTAIQVGKALQDPVQGVTALQRVGVRLTDSQKDLVEKLVKAGKSAEAQKLILQELQTEFGGSAEAAGKTFAGQLEILKNQFDDVKESIGGVIVKALTPLGNRLANFVASDKFQAWLEKLNAWLATNLPLAISWLTDVGFPFLVNAFNALWPIVKVLWDMFSGLVSFMSNNMWVFWALVTVLGVIKLAFMLKGALETFTTVINGCKLAYAGLQAVVATPMIMPALGIIAAVGSILFVKSKLDELRSSIEQINNDTKKAVDSSYNAHAQLIQLTKTGTPEQKARAWAAINKGYAMGTAYAPGGMALVGERGPELVNLPRGSQVHTAQQTKGMMSKTQGNVTINIGTIQNQSDADYIFRRMNRDQQRVNLGVSPAY